MDANDVCLGQDVRVIFEGKVVGLSCDPGESLPKSVRVWFSTDEKNDSMSSFLMGDVVSLPISMVEESEPAIDQHAG